MTLKSVKTLFKTAITTILIVGFIGGIMQGNELSIDAELADVILDDIEIYHDAWTFACTEAMVKTWVVSGFMALMLYGMVTIISLLEEFTNKTHETFEIETEETK